MCGVIATTKPTSSRLQPICWRPVTKLGPALRPTTPMNTARPILSKTQSAGSGMRPKVGRTERSHPNTRPMTSAPPLAVRLSGTAPTVTVNSPKSPPRKMPMPDKHHVGLARRPLDVAERRARALDVAPWPRRASTGRRDSAPCRPRTGSPRHRGSASTGPRRGRAGAATSAIVWSVSSLFVSTTSMDASGKIQQFAVLDLRADRARQREHHVRRAPIDHRVARRAARVPASGCDHAPPCRHALDEHAVRARAIVSKSATVRLAAGPASSMRKARRSHSR